MNHIQVEESPDAAGQAAARAAVERIRAAIDARGTARVIFASAPSQATMIEHLAQTTDLDWDRVQGFHMDEYLGLDPDQLQAFGRWLLDRLPAGVRLDRIRSRAETAAEIARYTEVITEAPIDVTCLGVGVNGHIAFNEPGQTDFEDPRSVREISLDEVSRQQQVDDGQFETLAAVPSTALTLTVPALVAARSMVCTVLGEAKAAAVSKALTGPVSAESCPASVLRRHPDASWFLDAGAASALPAELTATRRE